MERSKQSVIAAIICIAILALCTPAPAKIIYVDDDANGLYNGTSWPNAYWFLQDALTKAAAAKEPVEIHVAQGLYTPYKRALVTARGPATGIPPVIPPPERTDPVRVGPKDAARNLAFSLVSGVPVRGGYAGLGTPDPDKRDIKACRTILSGDLNGDDAAVDDPCDLVAEPTRAENSGVIVESTGAGPNTTLDGFILTGAADVALTCDHGHLSVVDCALVSNSSRYGGGAMDAEVDADLELTRCSFVGNSALGGGAALLVTWANKVVMTDCCFVRNVAPNRPWPQGGAVNIRSSNEVLMSGCNFRDNAAGCGGALSLDCETVELADCVFSGNTASDWTSSAYGGGAILLYDGYFKAKNCVFAGNRSKRGAAMFSTIDYKGRRPPIFHSCTFTDNRASSGSSIEHAYGTAYGSVVLANCILWDSGVDGRVAYPATSMMTYCDVRGGWPGTGNIDVDPCFVDPGRWENSATPDYPDDDVWVDGSYHLKSQAGRWEPVAAACVRDDRTSRCIDAGDPMSPVGLEPFPNGGRINLGAYGGTTQASKSWFGRPVCESIIAGDLNGDCKVNHEDLRIMGLHWLENGFQARDPWPPDGAVWSGDLTWRAGSGAVLHNVYFGTEEPREFKGSQTGTDFDPPLHASTTFYWRIDEVASDGTVTPGRVWHFSTPQGR